MLDSRGRGFTLIEVLLVIALIGILVGVMASRWDNVAQAHHLDESVERLRALVNMCRAQAMNEGASYRILIRQDGSLQVQHQTDVKNPNSFETLTKGWAANEVLIETVWVESILDMPDGPPPITIDDEAIESAEQADSELIPIENLENDVVIEFTPAGTSNSFRCVLRQEMGAGRTVTYDGRLGRLSASDAQTISDEAAIKPTPIDGGES